VSVPRLPWASSVSPILWWRCHLCGVNGHVGAAGLACRGCGASPAVRHRLPLRPSYTTPWNPDAEPGAGASS
jgi:hypothetical protein